MPLAPYKKHIVIVGFQTTYYFELFVKHVLVPQHCPLSLYTELKGPLIEKLSFYFLRQAAWPLDDFQGPFNLHGHNSWFACKAALRSTIYGNQCGTPILLKVHISMCTFWGN